MKAALTDMPIGKEAMGRCRREGKKWEGNRGEERVRMDGGMRKYRGRGR